MCYHDRGYYSLCEDDALIAKAREANADELAIVLADRLEQAYDPESGMTAAEMAASLKEIDKLEDTIDGLKADASGYENEITGLNSDLDDAHARITELEELLSQQREKELAAT